MSSRHCTDEELIAHLDCELGRLAVRSVRRHLAACWHCRLRMRELEEQALRIAKVVGSDIFPGPGRREAALQQFDAWRAEIAPQPAPRRNVLRLAVAAAVCVLALAGVLQLTRRPPVPSAPNPQAPIAAAVSHEPALTDAPYHQTLRIEITAAGLAAGSPGRLEIWSDAPGNRYAFEWRDSRGKLKEAFWKPGPRRGFRYVADGARVVPASLAGQADNKTFVALTASPADLRQLEAALTRWLRSRGLNPISLSANFAEFAGTDGARVRMERDASGVVRLIASRRSGLGTATLVLERNAGGNARSLTLRLEEPGRAIEMVLSDGGLEALRPGQLRPAVFEPKTPAPAGVAAAAPVPVVTPKPVFEERALDQHEIDVHYALHRVRACLGDPLQVERKPSGKIVVRGLVDGDARKKEILTVLRGLGSVDTAIETIAEAAREHSRALAAPPDTVSLTVANAAPPLRQRLEAVFSKQEAVEVTNRAISLSSAALSEAWAIHRLHLAFQPDRPDPLGLIEQMASDHAIACRDRLAELQTLLRPAIPAAPPESTATAMSTPLAATRQIDDLVRYLLAGGPTSGLDPDTALPRLAGALSAIDRLNFTEREP